MNLDELYTVIQDRRRQAPAGSYVASLFADGTDRIVQKVGEEAVELVIAAKNDSKPEVIAETADLLFHVLVLLAALDITPGEVRRELGNRRR